MKAIMKLALRHLVLDDLAMRQDRSEALDEMLADAATSNLDWSLLESFVAERRRTTGKIPTVKLIRQKLGCGLTEAMVICKGIEQHYDIHN